MNKGLRSQILRYLPEKIDGLRKDAQKHAEGAFKECSEMLEEGKFTPITKDVITVSGLYTGGCDRNSLWKNFYDEKITALFSVENITVEKVERDFKIFGVLYLKI